MLTTLAGSECEGKTVFSLTGCVQNGQLCSNNGTCIEGQCICSNGSTGQFCETTTEEGSSNSNSNTGLIIGLTLGKFHWIAPLCLSLNPPILYLSIHLSRPSFSPLSRSVSLLRGGHSCNLCGVLAGNCRGHFQKEE